MNTFWIIFQFIFAFGVMMFLHELGHFLMSKLFKVEVEEFGIGMPPRMIKLFTWDNTLFSLNWLPFGAFVKPKGEFGDDTSEGGFKSAKPWQQLLIYLGGPVMNLFTAFVIYAIIILNIGYPDHQTVLIDRVETNSPAEIAGIQRGDHILSIQGKKVDDFSVVIQTVDANLEKVIPLEVARGGETLNLEVTPLKNPPEGRGAMGIVVTYPMKDYPFFSGIATAFVNTGQMIRQYLVGIGQLISGKMAMGLESIVGPVGMYSFYEEAATLDMAQEAENQKKKPLIEGQRTQSDISMGWMNRLMFFAIISIALGVTNLFPIPALDGGRILFLLPELFFNKKLPAKVEYYYNAVGMVCLLLLMAFIMFKDIFMLSNG